MTFINEEAMDIANEELTLRRRLGLQDRVAAAVSHLTELVSDCADGTTITFRRDDEKSKKVYHYAVIKSGGEWFSTGSRTSIYNANDENLVAWLIGLGIFHLDDLDLFLPNIDDTEIEVTK
jgi:hypothetical protein